MKVLVTGASGFLGGALTRSLVQSGQQVRVLVRRTSRIQDLEGLPLEIHYGCLEDKTSLSASLFKGVEVIYNCAGLAVDWAPWQAFYDANVLGVQNLLEAAQAAQGLRRFVHVSTTDVYGYPVEACDETYPITDIGLSYNRSKGFGERIVWDFYQETGMPVTVVRPATVYGPRSQNIVVEMAALLLEGQMVLFDGGRAPAGLMYIDNAVEAMQQAAESPRTVGKAYNLRDEGDETWGQFIRALADGLGSGHPRINLPSPLALKVAHGFEIFYRLLKLQGRPLLTRHAVYFLVRDQGYQIQKAQQEFGFQSRVGFAEGMERTLQWLRSDQGQAALQSKLKGGRMGKMLDHPGGRW